eukprot:NODE_10849_length_427_cov_2.283069_g9732_i0.p2 GENE.NODE_10849_length_427_cov_2.283069_g9732_i0~~NODE_10849_length_427_cov_2.283069_g9732_i0.p2  ORF type:complete len:53 (-),score=10.01 NODE_10849_length_427_cov_2.283069_g9732_i0:157-315(-)
MNMQHHLHGCLLIHIEELLKHIHNKLHRCIIIIQQQYAPQRRFLGFGLCFGD